MCWPVAKDCWNQVRRSTCDHLVLLLSYLMRLEYVCVVSSQVADMLCMSCTALRCPRSHSETRLPNLTALSAKAIMHMCNKYINSLLCRFVIWEVICPANNVLLSGILMYWLYMRYWIINIEIELFLQFILFLCVSILSTRGRQKTTLSL